MTANNGHDEQVEGLWDDLVKDPHRFAGRRVKVTVLSDETATAESMQAKVRRWLAEGDALQAEPPKRTKPDPFGDILIEKFRKQGLVFDAD